MFNYNLEYNRYLNLFNEYLDVKLKSLDSTAPDTIKNAMSYAVLNGGKRVRPVLCLATAESLGVSFDEIKNYALAIEFIHSYSLVHDDLPSMDNDDYRRGKLSTHKKFGEAIGILAGDALLNFAFETCLDKRSFSVADIDAMRIISDFAGYKGMIAGQVLDLQNEKSSVYSKDVLYKIYLNKTAKLIMAPLLVSSVMANKAYYNELEKFGYNLGITFQIIDDVLDVEGDVKTIGKTPHKDDNADKLTSVKIFGLDSAKKLAKQHYENCLDAIRSLPNNTFLSAFADKMFNRKN